LNKLILHIGTHKTATTYTQSELKRNKALLSSNGIEYIPLMQMRKNFTKPFLEKKSSLPELINSLSLSDFSKLIISDENLLGNTNHIKYKRLYVSGLANVSRIIEEFEGVDITVILSLRNIAGYLPSMYSEYLRHYKFCSFDNYVKINNLNTIDWYEIFSSFVEYHLNVKFNIYNFDSFKQLKNKLLTDISFGILNEFSDVGKKSRSTLSFEAINFVSLFSNNSKEVVRKLEKSKYIFGEKFSPYSNESISMAKDMHEASLKKLEKLKNTSVFFS